MYADSRVFLARTLHKMSDRGSADEFPAGSILTTPRGGAFDRAGGRPPHPATACAQANPIDGGPRPRPCAGRTADRALTEHPATLPKTHQVTVGMQKAGEAGRRA